ncbi:hypothetical protein JXQ31_03615 [candidate division KSB1 bacterium]|nr:hypothetical protein [candidate division KSB1 bacterium]
MSKIKHYFIILILLVSIVCKVHSQPVYIGNVEGSTIINNNDSFLYDRDAMPCSVDLMRTADDPVNDGEEISIKFSIKNNGNQPLGPVQVIMRHYNAFVGFVDYEKYITTPPLLPGQYHDDVFPGKMEVAFEKKIHTIKIITRYYGDENPGNDTLKTIFLSTRIRIEPKCLNPFKAEIIPDFRSNIGHNLL